MRSADRGIEGKRWEHVIGVLYDTALGATTWQQALDAIRQCVRADSAVMYSRRSIGQTVLHAYVGASKVSECEPEAVNGSEHGGPVGGFIASANAECVANVQPDFPLGVLSVWRAGCGYSARDDRHRVLLGPLVCRNDLEIVIVLKRFSESPGFTSVEISKARRLLPHIERAVTLTERMDHDQLTAWFFDAAPGIAAPGLLLLDSLGRVLFLNGTAATLLDRQTALTLRDGRLSTPNRCHQRWLDMVTVVGHRESHCPEWQGDSARFTAFDGSGDLALSVWPWRASPAFRGRAFADAVTVGVLTSLDERDVHSDSMLQSLFGLSAGEARLIAELVSTGSLAAAAQQLGIQLSTARDRLKVVFRKTGFKSQLSVVTAVLRSPTRHLSAKCPKAQSETVTDEYIARVRKRQTP